MPINRLILEQINSLCHENMVQLVAVSKNQSIQTIKSLYDHGVRVMGENKAKELCLKFRELPKDIQWHFIGHLQSNKVADIIDKVTLIHSVDSIKLIEKINEEASKISKKIDILLQVYIAKEDTKYGFDIKEVAHILDLIHIKQYNHIQVVGLMGMATHTANEETIQNEFKALSSLFLHLKAAHHLSILSMGMSQDYSIAIDQGATMIRVGSILYN